MSGQLLLPLLFRRNILDTYSIRNRVSGLSRPCFSSVELYRYNPHLDPIGFKLFLTLDFEHTLASQIAASDWMLLRNEESSQRFQFLADDRTATFEMWHFSASTMIKLSLFCHVLLISAAAASTWITLEDEADVEPLDGSCGGFDRAESQLMEFSSPNYPAEYPPNIICIRKICAPAENSVYIDFRGSFFEIESPLTPDFCPFDYLELRNGPYGFSQLIGRYCGFGFPPLISADSGCVWMQFRSDGSLQGRGFKAVYHFVQAIVHKFHDSSLLDFQSKKAEKSPKCAFINIFEAETGMINSETVKKHFRNHSSDSLDCVWKIKGSNDKHKFSAKLFAYSNIAKVIRRHWELQYDQCGSRHQLRLIFSVFSLAFPNECELNFIEIYLSHTDNSHMSKRLCGTSASGMDLDSNVAHVRLFLHQLSIADTVVEILYYAYLKNSQCPKNYFSCGDSTCIPYALVCNGRSDCTSDFDETNCIEEVTYKMKFTNSPYLAVFIVFMATLVIISVGSILWQLSKCCRKKVERSTEEDQSNGANSALTDAKPKTEDSLTNELKLKLDVCNPIAESPYSTKKHCQPSLEDNTGISSTDIALLHPRTKFALRNHVSFSQDVRGWRLKPSKQIFNDQSIPTTSQQSAIRLNAEPLFTVHDSNLQFPLSTSKFRIPRPKPILLSTFQLPAYSSSARTDASTNASSSVDSPFAQDSTNTGSSGEISINSEPCEMIV
ncbi:Neuropilin and tolloid-like protein 2 [Trichinella patagoniensis]|uniref:Neuropilin and tolloid-like protein 2 n=1 Tax=Trichinella patagoniensis TaxID=990121 RepID=A0A0V1A0H3_9BILA|nr:Neuropilin and tolloid-like protein 2 [Trichinella patagoniensis]